MTAALWILFAVALFHHAQLGLQVVLEDYVHSRGLKIIAIVAIKFAAMALGAVSIVSILRISTGS